MISRKKFKIIQQMSSSKGSSNLLIFPFDAKFTFDMDNLAELLFWMRIKGEFALQNDPNMIKDYIQKRISRHNIKIFCCKHGGLGMNFILGIKLNLLIV